MNGQFKWPEGIKPVLGSPSDQYAVFLTPGPSGEGVSAVVTKASDQRAVSALQKQLNTPHSTATVSGGVVHVTLAAAAAGRCTLSK